MYTYILTLIIAAAQHQMFSLAARITYAKLKNTAQVSNKLQLKSMDSINVINSSIVLKNRNFLQVGINNFHIKNNAFIIFKTTFNFFV